MSKDSSRSDAVSGTRQGSSPLVPHIAGRDPRIGTTLGQGKYLISGKLGQGGMGVVYEAEDVVLQRRVAVKLLPDSVAQNPDALERFLREARAVARLNHPNVVAIHDVDQRDGSYYIVMELLRGGSASDLIASRGRLPWQEATRLIAEACNGLMAAHAVGLIHRDIKPANIMRSGSGVAKLADFGLAKITDHSGTSLTQTGNVLGTPDYMSPEQARSDPTDERTDIYSLGATYYKLLTGQTPYRADTALQILFAHCEKPIPDPRDLAADVPEACAAVIRCAMAKEPRGRFQTAADMYAALEATLRGAPAAEVLGVSGTPPDPVAVSARVSASRLSTAGLESTRALSVAPVKPAVGMSRRWLIPVVVLIGLVTLVAMRGREIGRVFWGARGPTTADVQAAPSAPLPVNGAVLTSDGRVEALAFSNHFGWLAAGNGDRGGGVRAWKLAESQQQHHLWSGKRVNSVSFAGGSAFLAAGTADEVRVWHTNTWTEWPLLFGDERPRGPVAFAGGPGLLATGSPKGEVLIWTYMREKRLEQRLSLGAELSAIAFSPDSKYLAAGGIDGGIKVWDASANMQQIGDYKIDGRVTSLAFSPSSELDLSHQGVYVAATGQQGLQFWRVTDRTHVPPWHKQMMTSVAYSPDGAFWAAGFAARGFAVRYNVKPGAHRIFAEPVGPVLSVAFSPDGIVLALGGADGKVHLLQVSDLRKQLIPERP
ncbi:MAG: protein kinase [Gemmataceae bacterium]|nr:protein kinase [Gemmataceae bacterium]